MSAEEIRTLEVMLDRLRVLYDEMAVYNGGVALLHLDAAIASLESHLRRQRILAA